jgi:HEAT repeat protein
VSVDATAVLTAIERKGASITASFRFLNARIDAESEMGAMIDTDRVQLELARDTFCEIDEEGRIRSLLFDPTGSGATANFARTLLGLMQFARPEGAGAGHWEIEEDDSSGNYRAQYNAIVAESSSLAGQEQNGVRTFRKTKLEYVASASDETREMPEARKAILPEGASDLTVDLDKGRIETISGSEAQTILIAGKIVGGAQNRFQLKLSNEDKASPGEIASAVDDLAARSSAVQAIALSAAPSEHAQLTAIYRSQLGDDSLETVKWALDAFEHGSSKFSYPQLYAKVKALIFLQPAACAELGTVLRSSHSSGPVAQLIAGALAAVGNTEAQAVLINTIRMLREDPATVQLLIELCAVKRPTQTAQDAVEEIAWHSPGSSVARAAQLTLGSMAHNLKQLSPRRAADIVEHARVRLSGVSGGETQLIALLGNSGVAEALPVLAAFFDHPSGDLRSRAALALRFIDGEQADEMLARALTTDPDESVRTQAANALEFRSITQTNFDAQKEALFSDKSDGVRLRVMRNLWRSHEAYPDVIALMERLAAKDSSNDVRKSAARLLASS